MMIMRCAWHRDYFGWRLIKGVVKWRPLLPILFSDGICDVCVVRFRRKLGPAPLGRLVGAVRRLGSG